MIDLSTLAEIGGMAAIPLNLRGHPKPQLGSGGFHLCPEALEMIPSYKYHHTNGYKAQALRCPLLNLQKARAPDIPTLC